jgi:murein DD-endopeptidase MepM/ murein hydrolase activator NlpD
MKKYPYVFVTLLIVILAVGYFQYYKSDQPSSILSEQVLAEEPDRQVTIEIADGDTFAALLEERGISFEIIDSILSASEDIYDFANIRSGKKLVLLFDHRTNELSQMTYQPNTEEKVYLTKSDNDSWQAEVRPINYDLQTGFRQGTITSSLYQAGLDIGLDEELIIELAEVFAWQVDFGLDVRVGDTFSLIYEDRYLNGKYIMPNKILAARYINDGIENIGYLYSRQGEFESKEGYFDEKGRSLQKILLKSPLQYRYISSGFTSARLHPITGRVSAHYAVDYAASYGTPTVSAGDGKVTYAGWKNGYGYMVEIRHNEMYTTRYGHFSRLAVQTGQKIKQNDVIAYVGSTGLSTGPHLHYEVHKFGSPVNPRTLELPSLEGLSTEEIPAFQNFIKQFEF